MRNFIQQIRNRINLGIALRAILLALSIGSGIALACGAYYLMRGYAVEYWIYLAGSATTLVAFLIIWLRKKQNTLQAAIFADSFFKLKDTLTSAMEFDQRKNKADVYQLQRQQAEKSIAGLDPKTIPLPLSKKLLSAAILTNIIAGCIAIIPPSERIQQKIAEEIETKQRTEEIQKALEKEIEELIKDLSDEEKEVLKPDELRKWVKQLAATKDKREALRNYARLEQKLQKTIDALNQRKDEALLKKAGIELEKAQESDAKELGKHLKAKDFKLAAQKLKSLKFDPKKQTKLSKEEQEKIKQLSKKGKLKHAKQKLSEKRKKLAKLRALSKKLAAAARKQRSNSNASNSGKSGASGKPGEGMDLADLPEDALERMLEELDQAAAELEEMLDEEELELMDGELGEHGEMGEGDDDMERMLGKIDGDLDQLRRHLRRMDARRKMKQRMRGLRGKLGLAQGYANGQSMQLGLAKGGKKPGVGSDNTRREEKDKLTDNQNYDKLKGQKGTGPSLSTIEDADSGTGSSHRQGDPNKQRDYQRQMSSFIDRDDVPEDMKAGIKQYFKDIHQTEQ